MEAQADFKSQLKENLALAEGKWGHLCGDLVERSKERAAVVARLLENEARFLQTLDEDVRTLNVGTFDKYVFPMIRATYANLISTDLFSVQPMSGPSALIFFLDVLYGKTKGSVVKGTTAESALRGHNPAAGYPSEVVDLETIGTGDGADTTPTLTALAWRPIRRGTVVIKSTVGAATKTFVDDGNGTMSGTGLTSGTVDYDTGVIALTYAVAPDNATAITATYEYVMEGNDQRPSLDLIISSALVQARTESLETKWSLEAEQDFQAVHGLEAKALLMAKVAEQLRYEIDRANIARVAAAAALNTGVTWDYQEPAGVDFYRHQLTFVNTLVDAGNRIFKATRGRAEGNWLVCGVNVASVIEALPQFQKVDAGGQKGVVKIGQLNQWTIYKDPWYTDNKAVMGHKGTDWLEAGYAYCPYVPLWRTPVITLGDMNRRVGLMTRYATKLINKDYFLELTVSNYGS